MTLMEKTVSRIGILTSYLKKIPSSSFFEKKGGSVAISVYQSECQLTSMGLLMIVFFSQCKMKHKTFCCGEGHQA
jgi:hypothetical protein